MGKQLRACLVTNITFVWRNRLPVVVGSLFLGMALLTMLPAFFLATPGKHLLLLRQLVSTLNGCVYWLSGAIALLTLSHHLRSRSVKLVLTKPCPLEVWLLSNFLSVLAIAFVLDAIIWLAGVGCSALWGLPVQQGLAYLSFESFCRTVIVCAYLILLTTLFHPAVAVLVAVMFQEGTFYMMLVWLTAAVQATGGPAVPPILVALKQAFEAFYFLLPSYAPFLMDTAGVHQSLRIGAGDLAHLGTTLLYAVCFASFCFWGSDLVLRRKRLT